VPGNGQTAALHAVVADLICVSHALVVACL
jgi:hypothetical protein